MHNFMDKINRLREDNDLTQSQVAEVLGTSQTMYDDVQNIWHNWEE